MDHAPQFIKQIVFKRYGVPQGTWVETGTYLGSTTRYLHSLGGKVITIEPEPTLYANAREALEPIGVTVVNGTSEEVLEEIVEGLTGDVNFWLDGHYSAGPTFKGNTDCPIEVELATIEKCLGQMGRVTILIDDVRLFVSDAPENADYPPLDTLVAWASANGFRWQIVHDIFIMQNWSPKQA
ncbi:MAG: hypothetical protein AAF771_04225 [Pseudomonadota bacterium]